MQKDFNEEVLIFILIPKPRWGSYVLYPCCAEDHGEFYSYRGKYSLRDGLTDRTKEILDRCNALENASLYDRFGKKRHKTERSFSENTDPEVLKNVKAFIDLNVSKLLSQIAACHYPLYLRETRLESIYKADRLHIDTEPLKPLMGFYRDSEKIRYTLRLASGKTIFTPSACGLKVITDHPGTVLTGGTIFYLPEKFSGTRLLPFLTKDEVSIPRQSERMYFRKFILKNLCNSEIEVDGFDVIQPENVRKALISLEKNIFSEPVFMLEFHYDHRPVKAAEPRSVIVELKEYGEEYCFYKINRDVEWENKIIAYLESQGLLLTAPGSFSTGGKTGWSAAVEWIEKHEAALLENEIVISQNKLNTSFYTGNWKINYSEEKNLDWFQLKMEIELEDGRKIRFQDMRECILSGKREFMLDDRTAFIIPEEWFARYTGLLLFGKQGNNRLLLHRSQFPLIDRTGKTSAAGTVSLPEKPVVVPDKLKAVLRDYQHKGFEWLYRLLQTGSGACLADDMGLGKTVQTIALLLKYKEENPKRENTSYPEQVSILRDDSGPDTGKTFRTCLIVTPASVVHNWKNELQKFAPSLSTLVYTGTGSLRNEKRKALFRWDAVITTYQTFRADAGFFAPERFGVIVFDESQNLKNPSSLVHRAARQLNSDFFIALSGTPIENSLSDLWSLMEIINKGLLGTYASFQDYFIRPIVADSKGIRSEMLHKLVAPYILRRTKEEVLQDLPERMDEMVFCEPGEEQKKCYEEELSRTRNLILEKITGTEDDSNRFVILQSLTRLRKLAIDPRLVHRDHPCESSKFNLVFSMLEEIAGSRHKVLLFSDYVSFLKLVAEEMEQRSWKYAMLTGSTRNREEVINRFSNDPECRFFLISLKAGGVGLNLTGADYVFILDPWWNVAAEEQAVSRAYRIGQKRSVFVYRFITEGTLEEKILTMQKDKQNLVDAVIRSGFV